jgi:hypothetical protein
VTVHLGLLGLGSLENLWDDKFSGFAYPARKSELKLIGNGVDAGNVVIQEAAKGYREGSLSFTAQSLGDRDLVRGYEEASTTISFTDYDGSVCDVQILEYQASAVAGDLWNVGVRLIQTSEPVPLGS